MYKTIPTTSASDHKIRTRRLPLFRSTQLLIEDRRCHDPTIHAPRIKLTAPIHAWAKATMEKMCKGWVLKISRPSKDGNITNKKENTFSTTATSIMAPCKTYLRFNLKLMLPNRMRAMVNWKT